MSEHFLERQHMELRKDLSKKKIEWEKERQLLLQKIGHLEIQLDDYENRERRLVSTQSQLMATIGNPKDDQVHVQTQQLLQELSSQVQMIRQATIQEGLSSLNGEDRKSDQLKMASPLLEVQNTDPRLSDRGSLGSQIEPPKFRSVNDKQLLAPRTQVDRYNDASLQHPQHHISGGYRKTQATNQNPNEAQTLSFGHELISQRVALKGSHEKGQNSELSELNQNSRSKKNQYQGTHGARVSAVRLTHQDSQGTIAAKMSQSNKKMNYTGSMPQFQISKDSDNDQSQENHLNSDHQASMYMMKQECLESSNTSDGPDDLLEASDTRTNVELHGRIGERNYESRNHQQSAVTLQYSAKHLVPNYHQHDQGIVNRLHLHVPSREGRSRPERGHSGCSSQMHPSTPKQSMIHQRVHQLEENFDTSHPNRYYVKPYMPTSSSKRTSQHQVHPSSTGVHPAHMESNITCNTLNRKQKPSANLSSHLMTLDTSNAGPGCFRSQMIEYSEVSNPHFHHDSGVSRSALKKSAEARPSTTNPFKDYSPEPQNHNSNMVGSGSHHTNKSGYMGHRPTGSTASVWVQGPLLQDDDQSPKTVDKYSTYCSPAPRLRMPPEKYCNCGSQSCHNDASRQMDQFYQGVESTGARIHPYLHPQQTNPHFFDRPRQAEMRHPQMQVRSSMESNDHLVSRGSYMASCSHLSSVNQAGKSIMKPRGTHNQSYYSSGSGAFHSTQSKKTKKSALLNSKMAEGSNQLTKKDVLQILKLHKSLEEKINYLEGAKRTKQKS